MAKINFNDGTYLTPTFMDSFHGTNAATGHNHQELDADGSCPNIALSNSVSDYSVSGTTGMKITTTYVTVEQTGTCRYLRVGSLIVLRIPQMFGTAAGTTCQIDPQTTWPAEILAVISGGTDYMMVPVIVLTGTSVVPGTIKIPHLNTTSMVLECANASAQFAPGNFSGTIGIEDQFIAYHVF